MPGEDGYLAWYLGEARYTSSPPPTTSARDLGQGAVASDEKGPSCLACICGGLGSDNVLLYEVDASSLAITGAQIPVEPSYLILNTAGTTTPCSDPPPSYPAPACLHPPHRRYHPYFTLDRAIYLA